MPNLHVETGLKEYDINGKVTLALNPTDPAFVERLYDAFITLDKKDTEYRERIKEQATGSELFKLAKEMDEDIRATIDNALGAEVCTPVFGNMSVYAIADGLPIWANLMLAIIDEMDEAFTREKAATDPRLKKYTAKFNKAGK